MNNNLRKSPVFEANVQAQCSEAVFKIHWSVELELGKSFVIALLLFIAHSIKVLLDCFYL